MIKNSDLYSNQNMETTDNSKLLARTNKIASFKNQIKTKLHLERLNLQESSTDSSSQKFIQKRRKSSTMIQTQQLFKAKYDILEKIGEGSSAIVYRCKHLITGQFYALKVCSFEPEHSIQIKEIFQKLVNLDHPNIIKLKAFYICVRTSKIFLVMEDFYYSDLQRYKPKDEQEIRNIAEKLLSAVDYLHRNGICHRDIKPSNILYDPLSQNIKLIDFNVSKVFQKSKVKTQMLTPTGTPDYRAPETYGLIYSQTVDEWSIGVTLYFLAVNSLPFQFKGLKERIKCKQNLSLNLFKEKQWKNFSVQFKDIIQKLLTSVQKRIQSTQALSHIWFIGNLDSSYNCKKINLNKQHRNTQQNNVFFPVASERFISHTDDKQNYSSSYAGTPVQTKNKFSQNKQKMSKMNKKIIKQTLVNSSKNRNTETDEDSLYYDSDGDNQIDYLYKSHRIIPENNKQSCSHEKQGSHTF